MTLADRDLEITYGSLTLNVAAVRLIHGDPKMRLDKGYLDVTFQFDFIISQATDALFVAEIAAVEDAFRTPRQRFTVTQGASTMYDLDPATNSGFNAEPRILKNGDPADTGNTRRYSVGITIQLPADLSGQDGRQDALVRYNYSCAKQLTLILEGTYTALASNGALAQYNASIDAYAASIIGGLSGTPDMELIKEDVDQDDTDKIVKFRREYREIIHNQSSGTLDNTSIIEDTLRIRRETIGPGDSQGGEIIGLGVDFSNGAITGRSDQNFNVQRLIKLVAEYECCVDQTVTKDLKTLWDSTIEPFIISQIKEQFNTGSGALTLTGPEFNYSENLIRARIDFLGIPAGSKRISYEKKQEVRVVFGTILVPVWDGDPLSKYQYPGPRRVIRTSTERSRDLGVGAVAGGGGGARFGGGGGGVAFGGIARGGLRQQNLGGGGILGGGFGIQGQGFTPGVTIRFNNPNVPKQGQDGGRNPNRVLQQQRSGWFEIDYKEEKFPLTIGTGSNTINVTDVVRVLVEERANAPKVRGGAPASQVEGGGGNGVPAANGGQ